MDPSPEREVREGGKRWTRLLAAALTTRTCEEPRETERGEGWGQEGSERQSSYLGSSEVGGGDCAKPLLPRGVPDLRPTRPGSGEGMDVRM